MAIEFEEENKTEQVDNNKTKRKKFQKTVKKRKEKNPLNTSLNVFLVFTVFAVLYSISYCATSVLTLLPAGILWLCWFALVALATTVTAGIIWISEGWREFNSSFMAFNTAIGDVSGKVVEVLYKIFPYVASVFGAIVITCLILSIFAKIKLKDEKYSSTAKLVWSIILAVLYVVFIILDVVVFVKF